MAKELEEKHLPLDGEESGDQHDLQGRVFKKSVSPLLIERGVEYAEAVDTLKDFKDRVEERKQDLIAAFDGLDDLETFIEVSTQRGNKHRFSVSFSKKLIDEKF